MAARLVEVATTALAAIDAASQQADADDFVHSVTRRREHGPRYEMACLWRRETAGGGEVRRPMLLLLLQPVEVSSLASA